MIDLGKIIQNEHSGYDQKYQKENINLQTGVSAMAFRKMRVQKNMGGAHSNLV